MKLKASMLKAKAGGVFGLSLVGVWWIGLGVLALLPSVAHGTAGWLAASFANIQCENRNVINGICASGGSSNDKECGGEVFGAHCTEGKIQLSSSGPKYFGRGDWGQCEHDELIYGKF